MSHKLIDIFKQYKSMLSRRDKRNRAESTKRILKDVLSRLKPGEIVIDCGANVGEVTGKIAQTGAEVHAFEPDPVAFQALQDKFSDTKNVTLHNAAVGIEDGESILIRDRSFYKNPISRTVRSTIISGGRRMSSDAENMVRVEVVDLLAFIRRILEKHGEIAFLKLDIEGAELDILERMVQDKLFQPIRLTVAETHEKKFSKLRARFRKLRKRISTEYPVTKVNLDWH